MTEPTQRLVLMTPEWAKQLNNSNNRALSDKKVKFYADEMAAGRWVLTHQGIALDPDGFVLDGGHRLASIIKYGKPIRVWLSENCSQETFDKIDRGRTRVIGETLKQMGVTYSSATAGAAKLIILFRYKIRFGVKGVALSASHIVNFVIDNPLLQESAAKFGAKVFIPNVSPSLLAAAHFLFSEIHPEAAECFCEQVKFGDSLNSTNPAFVFRTKMLSGRVKEQVAGAMLLKAWNKWGRGENVLTLPISDKDGYQITKPHFPNIHSSKTKWNAQN